MRTLRYCCSLAALALLLQACGGQKSPNPTNPPADSGVVDIPTDSTGPVEVPVAEGKATVKGTVYKTGTYCGGAAPTQEILEEARRPRPLQQFALYVRSGKTNAVTPLVDSVWTAADGSFALRLPPGDYCLLQREHVLSRGFHGELYEFKEYSVDAGCYNKWWDKCLSSFTVPDTMGISLKRITLHYDCDVETPIPCVKNINAMKKP